MHTYVRSIKRCPLYYLKSNTCFIPNITYFYPIEVDLLSISNIFHVMYLLVYMYVHSLSFMYVFIKKIC